MNKSILLGILGVLFAVNITHGQGIEFFQGSFVDLQEKARTEKKNIFIDFYTVWCGPCKLMAKEVFTDAEVAAYFNEKFISYQINAEDKAFAAEVKKYGVTAYPTLLIINSAGNVLNRQVGADTKQNFLKFGRIGNGEQLSFEQMYDKLKTEKDNDELIRGILLEAPAYLVRLEGGNRDKWELRVERLYNDYRKKKPISAWMNPEDFKVLMLYHTESSVDDEVMNYIMGHYSEVVEAVGQENVFRLVFPLHMYLTQDLARKGDLAYLQCLDRVKGDMKPMYDTMMNFGGKDAYTGLKYLNDGYYYIYAKKDVDKYAALMDDYIKFLGNAIQGPDYMAMVEAMSEGSGNKMIPGICNKYVEWLTAAMQYDLKADQKMNALLMLGDSYKALKNIEMAKKCYNQAYALSLQFNNPGLSNAVKNYITELDAQ